MNRTDITKSLFSDKAVHQIRDIKKKYIYLIQKHDIIVWDKQGYSHALRVDISLLSKQGVISKVNPGTKDGFWQMR